MAWPVRTKRFGRLTSLAVQAKRPRQGPTHTCSMHCAPRISGTSIAPSTRIVSGQNFGQLAGVVTKSKTSSGARAIEIAVRMV